MIKVTIAGFLARDPEARITPNGHKSFSFNVGCRTRKKMENGEYETLWFRCTAWGEGWEKWSQWLKKGSSVIVCGDLRTSLWSGEAGHRVNNDITVTSIDFSPFGKPEKKDEGGPVRASTTKEESLFNKAPVASNSNGHKRSEPIELQPWEQQGEVPF